MVSEQSGKLGVHHPLMSLYWPQKEIYPGARHRDSQYHMDHSRLGLFSFHKHTNIVIIPASNRTPGDYFFLFSLSTCSTRNALLIL